VGRRLIVIGDTGKYVQRADFNLNGPPGMRVNQKALKRVINKLPNLSELKLSCAAEYVPDEETLATLTPHVRVLVRTRLCVLEALEVY
jgi:hypothetical protein